jgi:hypothetical protein
MAQGIYNLLQETLKLTTNLNKQLCCEPTPPLTTTTTSSTSTSTTSSSTTSTTTSTTSTTTAAPVFTRVSGFIAVAFAGRQGFIASRASWYGGNTIASIRATNPDLVKMQVRGSDVTASDANNITFTYKPNISSPGQTVSPTYTTFDNVSNFPIMVSIKDFYQYANKIINNTYLSTRNPSVWVKRVRSSNGLGTGIPNDGLFLVGFDFDATGNEVWAYNFQARGYDLLNIPGTLNISNFTYSVLNNSGSLVSGDTPMYTFTPSTSWVNGVTIIPAYNVRVEENLTIPPGW